MAYYLSHDEVDDKTVVPYPSGTRYIQIKIKKNDNDNSGYFIDMRTGATVYCATSAASGYSEINIDGVTYARSTDNVSSHFISGTLHDVMITLNSNTVVGEMTIANRYTGINTIDYLGCDIYEVKFYDEGMVLLRYFDFSTNTGAILYGSDGVNGTIYGATWVDDGASETISGGSSDTITITTEGTGTKQTSGNSESSIDITTEGQGIKNASGGSESSITITTEGNGIASLTASGGSQDTITVTAEGTGIKHASGGSQASLSVSTEGSGIAPFVYSLVYNETHYISRTDNQVLTINRSHQDDLNITRTHEVTLMI